MFLFLGILLSPACATFLFLCILSFVCFSLFLAAPCSMRNLTSQCVCVCVLSHVWLFCDPMDCNPPGSSVHGILLARILEWVAISSFRGTSPPRNPTSISYISCIDSWVLYHYHHLRSFPKMKTKWKSFSCVWQFVTPWTIHSMEFSRPEYWSG